jgi:DNA-directed RNA polymerase subunit RPC12/RpoP
MRSQDRSFDIVPKDRCPICGANISLTEVEPHPDRDDWELNGYSCENCGPVKSLVVQRPVDDVPPLLRLM